MNISQIETKLKNIVQYFNQFEFIYSLLEAYNLPKASITRLRKGNLNLSKVQGEISWKKKLFFKEEFMFDLHETIIAIKGNIKHNERFIIVTDYKTFLAIDTLTDDKLDVQLKDLPKHYDFFLPWAGMEKTTHANENPADVKAAERMAKLFDEIKKENPDDSPEFVHSLNVFLSRLLFCFFAEDTNIFEENQFTNALSSHTEQDGSDLDEFLNSFFEFLNTPDNKRKDFPSFLLKFPYVNGGLFKDKIKTPKFNRKSRQAIIDSGELVWSAINPDIFGSMFQAVISVDQRGNLGQHYTSVPNIMKVIEPLFLNELREEFENAKGNVKKLNELTHRIHKIKVFDPACGSGNFLIIAYKELRKLEIEIFAEIDIAQGTYTAQFSLITLNNFFGIELDDFAQEIAKLALWLAEHQMNMEFFKTFGKTNPTLPLKDAGQITCGNACRLDWEVICPKNEEDEIFILGNPPYLGGKYQSQEQKSDMEFVFNGIADFGLLDYVSCWFIKGAKFLNTKSGLGFVTTSSICEGSQVVQLWPKILKNQIQISFGHQAFHWRNNAKSKAGVTCVIVGLHQSNPKEKSLYTKQGLLKKVSEINPYLVGGPTIYVYPLKDSISNLPNIITGNNPYEGGNLLLTPEERENMIEQFPLAKEFTRKVIGANEFINGIERWSIWVTDENLELALTISPIKERIEKTRIWREGGGDVARGLAKKPYKFRFTNTAENSQIIIPMTSSGRREYFPIGFLNKEYVILASALAIYDPEPYIFSVINSRIHGLWVKLIGGKMRADYRYNTTLCYNTFPFPNITTSKKGELVQAMLKIIDVREQFSNSNMAELYDPNKMPEELIRAHQFNDEVVERCYRVTPFRNDEERLEYLFKLYEKMTEEKQNTDTLFAKEKKTRKKK